MDKLGQILRQWRLERGMRQEDIEEATGIPQAYWSDIERGDIKDPGFSKVARLVLVLGRDLNELYQQAAGAEGQPVSRRTRRRRAPSAPPKEDECLKSAVRFLTVRPTLQIIK